jgi:hypothetical protein
MSDGRREARGGAQFFSIAQHALGFAVIRDIAKDEDDTDQIAAIVANRGRTVIDWGEKPVDTAKHRVIREPRCASFRDDARDGIVDRRHRAFIEDRENFKDIPARGRCC